MKVTAIEYIMTHDVHACRVTFYNGGMASVKVDGQEEFLKEKFDASRLNALTIFKNQLEKIKK